MYTEKIEIAFLKCILFFTNIAKLLTFKHEQETASKKFDHSLLPFLWAQVDEITQAWHTWSDDVSWIYLFLNEFQISDEEPFWNPSHLETLERFCMVMF